MAFIIVFLVYPVAFFFINDPQSLKWTRAHYKRGYSLPLMPVSVRLPFEPFGRRLYFGKFLVVALLLYGWAKLFGVSLWTFVLHIEPGQRVVRTILGSVLILAVGRLLVLYYFKCPIGSFSKEGLARGHALTWIAIILVGGLVEETWRGLTLSTSINIGFNVLLALTATAAASAFCRLLGIPSRITGRTTEVFWEFAVDVVLGGLYVLSHTVLISFSVNFAYNCFNLWLIRRTKFFGDRGGGPDVES